MHFDVLGKGKLHAVDGVSFDTMPNETVGLVGESGCGKSAVGSVVIRLSKATSGYVYFDETDVITAKNRELAEIHKKMQIIFQDPYSSLNPRETTRTILANPYQIYHTVSDAKPRKMVRELAESIGLEPYVLDKFPHELDGGGRQLTGIARALALKPKFIICDEPVSALDMFVQATIINLLVEMQKKMGLPYLFASHDLGVVRHIPDRAAVMYLGRVVELAPTGEIFNSALHPYTVALLSAVLKVDFHDQVKRIVLEGDVPSPMNPRPGCRFASHCLMVQEFCKDEAPKLWEVSSDHCVTRHYWKEAQNLLDN